MTLQEFKDVLHTLCKNYNHTYSNKNETLELKKRLNNIYENNNRDKNEKQQIQEIETFCSNYPKLLQVREKNVPYGIFDANIDAAVTSSKNYKLVDIKVKNKKQPDDIIYKNNREIQKNIPRGLTIFKSNDDDDDDTNNTICIYANKKFEGNDIDNDDNDKRITTPYGSSSDNNDDDYSNNNNLNIYSLQNVQKYTQKIASIEKINGEAVHFSCRYIFDKFYLFVGSKNNHIIIGKEKDVESYETEDRYTVAVKIARQLWQKLHNTISQYDLNLLFNLLHHTKMTAVCEMLQKDHQHIVPITNTNIVFLTFTTNQNNTTNLTALPPHVCINLMSMLKFTSATCNIIQNSSSLSPSQMIEAATSQRDREDIEGKVLYFLNDNNETIAMCKVKTIWYICLRALRQIAQKFLLMIKKRNDDEDIGKFQFSFIDKRYNEIKSWLNLSQNVTEEWKKKTKLFLYWFTYKKFKCLPTIDKDSWIEIMDDSKRRLNEYKDIQKNMIEYYCYYDKHPEKLNQILKQWDKIFDYSDLTKIEFEFDKKKILIDYFPIFWNEFYQWYIAEDDGIKIKDEE